MLANIPTPIRHCLALIAIALLMMSVILFGSELDKNIMNNSKFNKLTPEEEAIIIHKGTERPFTGKYFKHSEAGTYLCKRCDARLFKSSDKFDSNCGWPSFDNAIPGAIKEQLDADQQRTEIVCANCGGHLGHIFRGEHLTSNNIRHCVNSISLNFQSALSANDTERAYFAGGCFWGTDFYFQKLPGVISTQVGYMGGHTENPDYESVCTGTTGHTETIEIVFDPSQTSYEQLARLFFEIHDPTQLNRQGPDRGNQYRSAVFYTDDQQQAITDKLIGLLKNSGYEVVTKIMSADKFWPAEKYHQNYYQRSGQLPYCHTRTQRFKD